jgi:hypothetical protein
VHSRICAGIFWQGDSGRLHLRPWLEACEKDDQNASPLLHLGNGKDFGSCRPGSADLLQSAQNSRNVIRNVGAPPLSHEG